MNFSLFGCLNNIFEEKGLVKGALREHTSCMTRDQAIIINQVSAAKIIGKL